MIRILYHWTKDFGSFRLLRHQHTFHVSAGGRKHAQRSLGSSLHNTALACGRQCLRQIIARLWFTVTCWWRRSQNAKLMNFLYHVSYHFSTPSTVCSVIQTTIIFWNAHVWQILRSLIKLGNAYNFKLLKLAHKMVFDKDNIPYFLQNV